MNHFQMRIVIPGVVLGLMCCSCSKKQVELPAPESEITVHIDVPAWTSTRAGEDIPCPVNVLLVPAGGDVVTKSVTVLDGTQFSMAVPEGDYDIYAVCGLATALMPAHIGETIDIPEAGDFAAGSSFVQSQGGACTPRVVSITAERQMTRLDLSIVDVPDNIETLNLYVRGLNESYSIGGGWTVSDAGKKRFIQIPLTKDTDGTYRCSRIMVPCSDAQGVTFVVEATTQNRYTTLLTYTAATPLSTGTHLVQTLEYDGMSVMDGGLGVTAWNEASDTGTLKDAFSFGLGDQYFSLPASVVNISASGKALNLLPHRPMMVTLDEIRSWDAKNIPYTLAPEISVQRWAIPSSNASMRNIIYAISQIGWDAFDAQFASNGLTPIDRSATNIIAYRDKDTDTFYSYSFEAGEFHDIRDESGEWLLYPMGIVQMAE